MDIHPTNKNEVAWTSWLPPFLACWSAAPRGPVLEIGIGHFSTPAIHALVVQTGAGILSLEDNEDWLKGFKSYALPGHHEFLGGKYDTSVSLAIQRAVKGSFRYSVGLIDHSPGGQNRLDAFLALLDFCHYLVIHDYHRENSEAIDPYKESCSGWKVCDTYQPPTLVCSKYLAIPASLL